MGARTRICKVVASTPPVGATLMMTNQTTSYRTGDDSTGNKRGRLLDWDTLNVKNPFGNTLRRTDRLGGTTYADGIMIDWSTFDGTTVLGWRITSNGVNIDWNGAVDGALATSIGTYTTGWGLPNREEMYSLARNTKNLNYPPFNNSNNFKFWTSSTYEDATTYAISLPNRWIEVAGVLKTTSANMRYYPCRVFTVTGTTLT